LSRYIFTIKACIENRKKILKQQYLLHMSSQYGELRPINGWDRLASLGHHSKFQLVSRLGFVILAIWSTSFYRGRHVYLAGRPSRWASAHILVFLAKHWLTGWHHANKYNHTIAHFQCENSHRNVLPRWTPSERRVHLETALHPQTSRTSHSSSELDAADR